MSSTGPIEFSYYIAENLYAGEYPGDWDEEITKMKIADFHRFGITDFIDLTKDPHLLPYEPYILDGMVRHSFPIQDRSTPEDFQLPGEIFKKVESLRSSGRKVYIHCWGGIGRTGLVVACWLGQFYHLNGKDALDRLKDLWRTCPKSKYAACSPENELQRQYVVKYLQSDFV
ncbi:MAG: dual specificity protein phosphatase family protein [Planctomycetia bacterium]|nr:dual specificity protein phosphatase family protein [Planctomycetia bacterium]